MEDMDRLIKVYQHLIDNKQLVVIVDSLHCINTTAKRETRDIMMYISDKLKEWTTKFDVPVIAISELRKLQHPGMKPTNDDLKEVSDLKYDADATILLYNELHSRRESERTFVGSNGMVYPVVELIFYKNKTSGFKGTLFYKFYTDTSKFEECSIDEHRQYWSKI
jgi:replicative DNA helicase